MLVILTSLLAFPGIMTHKLSASLSPALDQSSIHSTHSFTERAASLLLPPWLSCRASTHPLQCFSHVSWLAMSVTPTMLYFWELTENCNSSCLLSMPHAFVHVLSCLLLPMFVFFFSGFFLGLVVLFFGFFCFWGLFCSCHPVPFTLEPYALLNCGLWSPFPSFLLQSFPHEVG